MIRVLDHDSRGHENWDCDLDLIYIFQFFFLYRVNFIEILMIFVEIGNADVDLYYYDELSDRD